MSNALVPTLVLLSVATLGAATALPARAADEGDEAPSASPAALGADAPPPAFGSALCPSGTLPDGDACVRVTLAGLGAGEPGGPDTPAYENAHHDKQGHY